MSVVNYSGRVELRDDPHLPFLVVVTSSDGVIVAKYPMRNKAQADEKLAAAIERMKMASIKHPARRKRRHIPSGN